MSVETLQASLPNDSHLTSFEETSTSESAELSAGPSLTGTSTLVLGELLAKQLADGHKKRSVDEATIVAKKCKESPTSGLRHASAAEASATHSPVKATIIDRKVVGLSPRPAPLAEEFYDTWDGAENSTEIGPSCGGDVPSPSLASPRCGGVDGKEVLGESLGYSATQLSLSLGATAAAVLAEASVQSPAKAAAGDTLLDLTMSQLGTSLNPSPRSAVADEEKNELQLTQVVEDLFGGSLSLSETAFDEVALNLTATLAELSRSMSPTGSTNQVELPPKLGETDVAAVKEILGAARCAQIKEEPTVKKQSQATEIDDRGQPECNSQKVSIDQDRLKAFSAAVEGAAGLDESLQGELLRLLNSWDAPAVALRA